jgi:hypothetical protein
LDAIEASLNEKEAIEKAVADAFIKLYNCEMGTSFCIVEYADAPDIRCKDSEGNKINFEITVTEDRPKDIQAALGRSKHRSKDALIKHLAEVRAGKANPLDRGSCLQGNVTAMIVARIQSKLKNNYGSSVALVVRDSSPVSWDWDCVTDQIKSRLNLQRNPFDKGIWILSFGKDRIYRIL